MKLITIILVLALSAGCTGLQITIVEGPTCEERYHALIEEMKDDILEEAYVNLRKAATLHEECPGLPETPEIEAHFQASIERDLNFASPERAGWIVAFIEDHELLCGGLNPEGSPKKTTYNELLERARQIAADK